jgi:tetratricopeptide (TPR) repeat protein
VALSGVDIASNPPGVVDRTLPRAADIFKNSLVLLTLAAGFWAPRPAALRAFALPQALTPTGEEGHNQLGLRYLREGNLEAAASEFRAAVVAHPDDAEALSNLAVVLGRQGREREAERFFREALQSNPQNEDAHLNLALLLERQGRLVEARAEAEKAAAIAPRDSRAYTVLGSIQAKLDKLEDAVASFRKAADLDPLSADTHLNLGIALAELSESQRVDLTRALAEFSQAVRLAPNSAAPHYHRGRALFNLDRYAEAEPELEAALKLQPNDPASLYVLGLTESQLGRIERSNELLTRVTALNPQNAKAHYFLGQNLLHQGDTAGAIAQWREAAKLDPEDGPTLYNLSLALRRTDPSGAHQYGMRYLELQNRHRVTKLAESAQLAAEAAAQKGDWQGAVNQLKQAVSLCGDCSIQLDLRRTLGLAYCYADQLAEGERELREVLKQRPSDLDAQRAIEIINLLKKQASNAEGPKPEPIPAAPQ